jgi:hypothetical protein
LYLFRILMSVRIPKHLAIRCHCGPCSRTKSRRRSSSC